MSRVCNPNRAKALELYIKSNGKIKNRELAEKLDVPEATVRGWKHRDKWEEQLPKKKRGGQPGNENGARSKNVGNQHNLKHGLYAKVLPKDMEPLLNDLSAQTAADILWDSIMLGYATILRAQKKIKSGEGFFIYIQAMAPLQNALARQIAQYEELVHKNWDLCDEEQRARIDVLKAKIGVSEETEDDGFLEALEGKVSEIWESE